MKGSDSRGNRGNAGVACIAGRGGRVVHQKIRAGVGFAQGGRGHLRRDLPDRETASGPSDTEDQAWRAGGRGAVYRAHQASCGQGQAGF